MWSQCTITGYELDLFHFTSPTSVQSATFYVYVRLKSPRTGGPCEWFQLPQSIYYERLPAPFTVSLSGGDGFINSRYLDRGGAFATFTISPADAIVKSLSATIKCNGGNTTHDRSWDSKVDSTFTMNTPTIVDHDYCTVSVSLKNANAGTTLATATFAMIQSSVQLNQSVPIDLAGDSVSKVAGELFQTTADSVTVDWANHFFNDDSECANVNYYSSCVSGIVSYSYNMAISISLDPAYVSSKPAEYPATPLLVPCISKSLTGNQQVYTDTRSCLTTALQNLGTIANHIDCVGCFTILLQPIITACNEVGRCVSDTMKGARFSAVPPKLTPLSFSKVPYLGKLWYSNVTSARFATNISSATSQPGPLNIDLRIAVGGYADDALTTLFDANALPQFAFEPPSPLLQSTTLKFLGNYFHGEPYVFTLAARRGSIVTTSATVWLDLTPPIAGSARFTELVKTGNAQRADVAVSGFFDPESGVKEIWTRVGSSAAACTQDFGNSSSWTNFTKIVVSDATNSPVAEQTISVDLADAQSGNWSSVYFSIAVLNHAWTSIDDTTGVTYACLDPITLDRSTGSIVITQIAAGGDSESQIFSNDTNVEVHWLTSDLVAGVAFVTANLTVPGLPTVTVGPFYEKSSSLTIPAGGNIMANLAIKVCMNATSNAVPPAIVSTCKETVIPPKIVFDASCVQTGVIFDSLQEGQASATGNVFSNWTSCTLGDITEVRYWLVQADFTLVTHGSAQVRDQGVVIHIDETWTAADYKYCFMATTAGDYVTQNFCTNLMTIDPTPARSLGGITDVYSGAGFNLAAVPVRSSSNTASYLVTWDDWSESESGLLEFNVTLWKSSDQTVVNTTLVAADARGLLFQNLKLVPGNAYYASLSAINKAGLQSRSIVSPGVTIVASGTSGSPQISVENGISVKKDGKTVRLFIPRTESIIRVSWSGFVGSSARAPSYRVDLTPTSGTQTSPSYTYVVAQNDYALPVPGIDNTYTLSITLINADGTQKTLAYGTSIWANENLSVSPPSTLRCVVDFTRIDKTKKTVPLSVDWSSGSDPFGFVTAQTIGFRRVGNQNQASGTLAIDSTSTSKSAAVSFLYGPPSALDDYTVECVWRATDLTGAVTTVVFPGGIQNSASALAPAVLALSTWTQLSTPHSASDFAFFDDVSITPNSTFMVGLQSFPPLIDNGVQLASLSYSINYLDNDTLTYVVPPTDVDMRAADAISHYQIRYGSVLLPIYVFDPKEFLLNGGFPLDLTTVYICATVTTISTSNATSACSNGIMLDSLPPTAGTVSIDDGGLGYLTSSGTVSVSWSGFAKTNWPGDSGIFEYAWGIGSFAGADDFIPFSRVSGMVQNVTTTAKLIDGSTLYATVVGFDNTGRAIQATSPAVVVDTTPPTSANSNVQVLAKANPDGSTFVRASFSPWRDDQSGMSTVVWTIESMYGAADLLPTQPVTYGNLGYATLRLSPGATYLIRVTATNRAQLSTETVASFTTERPVQLVYLVDGTSTSRTELYEKNAKMYSSSWKFTGQILDFVVGIGTAPRQDNLASFKRMDASVGTLQVPLNAVDGVHVYTTIFVQDSSGTFQSFVSPGMMYDSSPPIRGWINVGGRNVHEMTVPHQASITASWMGFSDSESDISRYEWCLDLDDNVDTPTCAVSGRWFNVWTELQVVDAPLTAPLPINQQCFVKIRATNMAGLSVVASSPPFMVDPQAPQGGELSISFPGVDPDRKLSPVAPDGTQLYLDRSSLNVSWSSFTGNIEQYRVALFQNPGTQIKPFVNVAALSSWTFSGLSLNTTGPGASYFAVVQAWSAAGIYSEKIKRFRVVTAPPGTGTVTIVSASSGSISFYVLGFADINNLGIKYEVSVGLARFEASVTQETRESCKDQPCSYDISASLTPSVMYFLTVRAVNDAGLWSDPTTVPVILSAPMLQGYSSFKKLPFSWNITTDIPHMSAWSPNITLSGAGLANFLPKYGRVSLFCNFTDVANNNVGQWLGDLQAPNDEDHPTITCPSPYEQVQDGDFLTLKVLINGTDSNLLRIWRRDQPPAWSTAVPQTGPVFTQGSTYRVSTTSVVISWTTNVTRIAFWQIKQDDSMLSRKYPSTDRSATVLLSTPLQMNATFSVCPSFAGEQPLAKSLACIAAPMIKVALFAPTINTAISNDHPGPLSTTVRINASSDLLPLGTSQFIGTTPVAVDWTGTFLGSEQKRIVSYSALIGTSPGTAINGSMIRTTGTTASFSIPMIAGVPYFATVIPTDEVGLQKVQYSSAFIAEVSPPDTGGVHIGRSHLAQDVSWQRTTRWVDFYLKQFSDHISGISNFSYRICNATLCTPSVSIGLSVDNRVPADLVPGVPYWISVQAVNGAGRASAWVNSSPVTVDSKAPVVNSVRFTGVTDDQRFALSPISNLGLSWNATGAFAPIREYKIQLGTTRGGGQLLPPTNVGSQTSFSLAALPLTHNIVIYATVKAVSENGLEGTLVSAGLRTDFTEPQVVGDVVVLSGSGYVKASGVLNVTASWDGVFSELESSILKYQWAIGTAGIATQYTGTFLDVPTGGNPSFAWRMSEPKDNSHFVVTVKATNLAGLTATASSAPVLKSATTPWAFNITALNEGKVDDPKGRWIIPSSIGRFNFDGLSDPISGIKDVRVQLQDADTKATVLDWFSVGVLGSLALTADQGWISKPLLLNAKAINNVGLEALASSPPFVMNSTDPI
ncbi:hypothetical protein BDZ88DRAFT_492111 [Geranomyces variabilis]|nr:hypothetical protein BDZ88DRAFT_492111 [Geranomyces variabilis]